MKNKFPSQQAGFSLIELLIVVVIFGVVFTVIARVMLATVTSDARLTEQSEAQTRSGIVSDVLQKDFAQPLRLLSSLSVARSGTSPIAFEPNAGYDARPGEATLIDDAGGEWLKSTLVLKDGGAIAGYAPPADSGSILGWRSVTDTRPEFVVMQISPPQRGAGRSFSVVSHFADGGTAVSGEVGIGGGNVERTGTVAEFDRIEARVERLSIGCRIGFFSVLRSRLTLLARSNGDCPPGPLEVVAAAEQTGGQLSQLDMSGSFEDRAGGVKSAPLPFVQGTRITKPVFINRENNDLVLFRAEDATDKTFMLVPASFQPYQQTQITVRTPARGRYKTGDYVFLVDYSQSASVVCRVAGSPNAALSGAGNQQQLSVEPVFTPSSAAWGLFYSLATDFAAVNFSTGTEIVQLAPPVIYRYLSATKILVRREGTGLFQTVAPGIAGFNAAVTGVSLNVDVLANTEGVETPGAAPAQSTRLSIPIK